MEGLETKGIEAPNAAGGVAVAIDLKMLTAA